MDFKQLESYAAVVQCRSFTKAAQQLYLSQPTVSTHIRALEEELNTCLITRTTKSIEITPEGMKVYDYVLNLLDIRNRMKRECAPDARRILHLGASTIPSAYILPEILPEFSKRSPNTFFVIHQSDSQSVADGVIDGVYDVGLVGMPVEWEGLMCQSFCQDRMILIAPVTEYFLALHSLPQPPLEELLKSPMILREKGTQKNADRFLEEMQIPEENLTISARINDPEAIKNLVAGGLGVSIISQRAAKNFLREKRLLEFSLPKGSNTRQLYLLCRKEQAPREYLREFIGFVLAFYEEAGMS